ncbi:hypothetical protein ACYPKM_01480 [Pseudomonas aeruginosa]
MHVEVVQKIDSLAVIIKEIGNIPNPAMATRYLSLIKRSWDSMSAYERRRLVLDEDFHRQLNINSDAQLLDTHCAPPSDYLLCPEDEESLITCDHIVWYSPEQAWIKPLPQMIGKRIYQVDSAALPLPEDDPWRHWDESRSPAAMASRNAKIANENGLEYENPFIKSSNLYNAFERGWNSAALPGEKPEASTDSRVQQLQGLNDVQVAFVQHAERKFREKIVNLIRSGCELIVHLDFDMEVPIYVLAARDQFVLGSYPTAAEAIALGESLGLKTVFMK